MRRWLMVWITALVAVSVGQAAAQSSAVVWDAAYYDNPYLLGSAANIGQTDALSFDWGQDGPAGVNVDGFSARYVTRAYFAGGTYRFFALADDNVRVSVNFAPLIDTFDNPSVGQLQSADISLPTGTHQIQVDYREETSDAYLFVSWQSAASNPQDPNFPPMTRTVATPITISGWTAQYYGNPTLGGLPTAITAEEQIQHDWGTAAPFPSVPTNDFSARWTTTATLAADTYQLSVRADDGVRVQIDGQTVLDRWQQGGGVGDTVTRDVTLSAGTHNITVEYYELGGDAFVSFEMATVQQVTEAATLNGTPIAPLSTPIPAATPSSSGGSVVVSAPAYTNANGTVSAYRLNMREEPTTNGRVLTKVNRDERYAIVGRTADSSWWQIDVNGTLGWVSADFMSATNTGAVPVTTTIGVSATRPGTGYFATTTTTLNLRSEASRRSAILAELPRAAQVEITGRDSTGSWLQVNYDGKNGWVSRSYVSTSATTTDIPIAP